MNVTIAHQTAHDPARFAAHRTPEAWAQANRLLLRKAIAEYAHELIVEPEQLRPREGGFALYQLFSDDGAACYQFEARRLALLLGAERRRLGRAGDVALDLRHDLVDAAGVVHASHHTVDVDDELAGQAGRRGHGDARM